MDQIEKQVRRARWRLALERFVRVLGWCCFATLLAAAVLIGVDKVRSLGVEWWGWVAGAVGLGLLAAVGWAALRARSPLDAAIELDRRFGLKERVSSTLALSPEERASEIGQALVADAARRVGRVEVDERFGISPGRQILLPLVPLVLAVAVALFVSPMVAENPAGATPSEVDEKQVKEPVESLHKKLVRKREEAEKADLKDAQDLFRRLEQGTEDLAEKSKGDKKQALVELNDLNRQIEQRRSKLGGAEEIRKQLNQLKDLSSGPADKLAEELKRGNFDKARDQLEQLQADLASGKLTPEDQEKLADQLAQMQKAIQDLADAHQQAMNDLQNRIDQARQAGRDGEANELQEKLDELRRKMPQMDQLRDMAGQMGQCSKCLRDGQLQDAGQMLDQLQSQMGDLDQQLQELEMLSEAMDQVAQARQQMNCGQCGGAGCEACQGPPGVGLGAGQGIGPRPEEEDPNVGFYDADSPVKVGPGSAVVVGEVEGPNVAGKVQEGLKDQFEAAKRESADPLTGQRLPRKVRDHAKEYFDRLREGE
jgi:hypothetical protein